MSRILLIDDDERFRDVTAKILRHHGHDVIEATDGRDGLRKHVATEIDVILCDIVMPEMEGQETIMTLREGRPQARIIAMSGSLQYGPLYLRTAEALGANMTLAKPFTRDILLAAIAAVTESSRPKAGPAISAPSAEPSA